MATTRRAHLARFALLTLLALVIAAALARVDRPLRIAAGTYAHDLCTETFVSGLEPAEVFSDALASRGGLDVLSHVVRYDIDRSKREVGVRLAGIIPARAVYREGLGCILVHGEEPTGLPSPAELAAIHASGERVLPPIADANLVAPADARLAAALEHAFSEEGTPLRQTKAVVVVHDGRVVAEKYAPGFTMATPVLGFSISKSVVNALVGILVQQGRLRLDAPAPVERWHSPADPRREITLEQLLRMESGLDLDEENAGYANPSDRMFYLERDMSAFAESARLIARPGTRWAYSSATTHIVAQIVRDTVGGTTADYLAFARRELFAPLGMDSALIEVDSTGTPIGAHYTLATARDWAAFGLLYLNDGVIAGRRILPEGWVAMSAASTLGTNYGAGFWTNRNSTDDAKARAAAGMPADAFFASGNLGQRIVVLPAQHTVIVRLGDAAGPGNDIHGLIRLVREVIASSGG